MADNTENKKNVDKLYLSGKEVRAIAKANAKDMETAFINLIKESEVSK